MSDNRRLLSPSRWAVFEVEPEDSSVGGGVHVWLKSTGAEDPDLGAWAERKWQRLERIAHEQSLRPLRFRDDLSSKHGPRFTVESRSELRATIVAWLTAERFTVVPAQPIEVYAVELLERTSDGRPRLYVGVTSDLARRLAEHRGEIENGVPSGRAVRRHGFRRYRDDLVEHFPRVPKAAAPELEAQVSALLRHRGFEVHGDGVRRRPAHTRFVFGVSWDQLQAAYEDANPG